MPDHFAIFVPRYRHKPGRGFFLLFLLLSLLSLAACGGKAVPTRDGSLPSWMGTPKDLRDFPQNLEIYAKNAGFARPLISTLEQDRLKAEFERIFFAPWQMGKSSVRKHAVSAFFRKARGFKSNQQRWTQAEWNELAANADLESFPNRRQPAITLRNTNLREMPTLEPRFSEPTSDARANPFDYFQYSLLPIGTPIFIAHISLDGQWYFIECPIAAGWVRAEDIAFADADFMRLWQCGRYAALIRDHVTLPGTGINGGDSQGGIGTLLPLQKQNKDGSLNLLLPLRGAGNMAIAAETTLTRTLACIQPLPLNPGNVAMVGNAMIGQRYGWGGMFGERDCSALTRDLFTPFALWLPRNSAAQARKGAIISLEGLSQEEKKRLIEAQGVPFLSLLGMRGHISLYIGTYKGRPAIFHNVWGLRTVEKGNDNGRFIIGRAVVTSITPGLELRNLYRPQTFVDRLRSLNNPASERP